MYCAKCGSDVPEGNRFCSNCGTEVSAVSAAPAACPSCGAEVSPDIKFCGQCGQSLAPSKSTAIAPALAFLKVPFLKQALVSAAGAILMLIALAVPWYSYRGGTLGSSDLLSKPFWAEEAVWAGWGLPVMLVICIASLVLLAVAVSLWTGRSTKVFWYWMGILGITCVVANGGYVGWWTNAHERFSGGLVHAGFVLALVGGIIVLIGASMRTTEPEP